MLLLEMKIAGKKITKVICKFIHIVGASIIQSYAPFCFDEQQITSSSTAQ